MRNVYVGLVSIAVLGWSTAMGCGGDAGTNTSHSDGGTTTTSDPTSGGGGADCAASELCNGLDDDCNGEVDEGCNCILGDTQSCWSGDPELVGIGSCTAGTQTCDERGEWGACEGEVLPSPEACDGNDNDCNGLEDEGFGQVTCGVGACQVTVEECIDGTPNPCVPGNANPVEQCDGVDDDCDGVVDNGGACVNGDTQPFDGGPPNTRNVGGCAGGTQTCVNGMWSPDCVGDVVPQAEICNGDDDDCNNAVDDNAQGVGLGCQAQGQQGICVNGTTVCASGSIACQPGTPQAEICNNIDDDCNGVVDNGNPGGGGACTASAPGICANGTLTCINGSVQCAPGQPLPGEICNGLDDDCDNQTDEGNPGGGGGCIVQGQQGVCAQGVLTCGGGTLGCSPVNGPVNEAPTVNCDDSQDNDCDGTSDAGDADCCPHDMCTQGGPLDPVCGGALPNCITTVCANDAFCCTQAWDGFCISEINTECFSTQCSTCAHNLCVTGAALTAGCDGGWCVGNVCADDPFCCDQTAGSWDSLCVQAVATQCAPAGC